MNARVILDGLASLQPDEEVTAEQIVRWIIGALGIIPTTPHFTITSAGVVNREFFVDINSLTAKSVYDFDRQRFVDDFFDVVNAVGQIFDVTIVKNSLGCWTEMGQFMCDLQKYCKNDLFTVVSGFISVSLLKKIIAVESFDKNADLISSMKLYYECGIAVTDKKSQALDCRKGIRKHLFWQYVDCVGLFFELIGKNVIFSSSDDFLPTTSRILLNGLLGSDKETVGKYLNSVKFVLESDNDAAKHNMAMFLPRIEMEQLLRAISKTKSSALRTNMLNILTNMLRHFQETNVQPDFDWTMVFVCILYWPHAVDLLLLETKGTEEDEQIQLCNLFEGVIRVFLRHNDEIDRIPVPQRLLEEQTVDKFINLLCGKINFGTCETLFSLLSQHVEDSPATCNVIILFIDNAAKTLANQPDHQIAYENVITTVYNHFERVRHYPELLCRLINIVPSGSDYTQISPIALEAFYRCNLYGTAVDLLTVIKNSGIIDSEIIIDTLMHEIATTRNRTKETLTLILAAHDVFDIFLEPEPADRRMCFDELTRIFNSASGDEEILCASVMMHMLAAFQATEDKFPGEEADTVENQANEIFRYLSDKIKAVDKMSFVAVHINTVAAAEDFLKTILYWGYPATRFALFVESVHCLVMDLKKQNVNLTINKLFTFIRKTVDASACEIASMIFIRNLQLCLTGFSRRKVVQEVQRNLFKNQLNHDTTDYRPQVMTVLSARIEAQAQGPIRKYLEDVRQYVTNRRNADNAPANEAPDVETGDDDEVPETLTQSPRGTDIDMQ